MMKYLMTAAASLALLAGGAGAAKAWPDKPLKIVVPYAAGGNTDILARTVQGIIAEEAILESPLTVVNVGGHYSIGAQRVRDAAPDGTTFLLMHSGLLSGEASGVLEFGYRDFRAVAATGQFCQIPTVREDSAYADLGDLLGAAKERPGEVVFGVNLGGNNHMAALALQSAEADAAFRFVQIGGGAANFAALTGEVTEVAIFTGGEFDNYKASGLRALAYMGDARLDNLPDLATAAEQGYDVTYCITNYWFAPADTPQEAIDGFADALEAVMQTDKMKAYLAANFTAPVFARGEALDADLEAEYALIEPVAKLAKSAAKK